LLFRIVIYPTTKTTVIVVVFAIHDALPELLHLTPHRSPGAPSEEREEKGERRKEKGERRKEKGERRKERGEGNVLGLAFSPFFTQEINLPFLCRSSTIEIKPHLDCSRFRKFSHIQGIPLMQLAALLSTP
jgi:hypothetical protein